MEFKSTTNLMAEGEGGEQGTSSLLESFVTIMGSYYMI